MTCKHYEEYYLQRGKRPRKFIPCRMTFRSKSSGHSCFLPICPDPFTRIFKVKLSSSLRPIFTASMDQKELIDSVAKLMKECDEFFTTFDHKAGKGFLAFLELRDTVGTQLKPWPAIQKRIERWRIRQQLGSFRPKVDDVLRALELFASTLREGEPLALQKSSAYRSADLSKIVLNELLKLESYEYAQQETIEESKKLEGAMNHLLKLFPSSNSEENVLPNNSELQLIPYMYSPDNQLSED
ncbi:uncharacterized protein BDZ83DRAFT_650704 [Colletotrichum acutatum]|uniref:Uncharacterized protein n=1 Tax=Glomerella acutata TaxID=27357 RepID=A0AAD8UMG3_GLOAC|nr:uncharacterized protein BDZ83DRAFT_650704 [Colletotrichum acutatum]KAK1726078.1 hypothetical protein BDZ83DRAFT_650704 [Colletotrichum acutatum]